MKNLVYLIPSLALAAAANAATITLDFETGTATDNQYTNNFRGVKRGSNISQTDPTQPASNHYLAVTRPPEGSEWNRSAVAIYDTTPADVNDALPTFGNGTITIDFRVATSANNQGFGIYLFESGNMDSNNLFARFSINADGGSNDRISFSKDGSLTLGNSGNTVLTDVAGVGGTWGTSGSPVNTYHQNGPATISDNANPTWHYVTLTYTPGINNDTTLKLAYKGSDPSNLSESFSATVTISNADRIYDPALGIFIHNPTDVVGATAKIDDIVINYTPIPEPSSFALLTGAFMGGLFICQRKRRA